MSRAPTHKRSEEGNSRKNPSAKTQNKENEQKGWRDVLVWVIPLGIGFLLTLIGVIYSSIKWLAIASTIGAVIAFLGYFLFLAEWYVWKGTAARKRARIIFSILSVGIVTIGSIWVYRVWAFKPQIVPPIGETVKDRPFVFYKLDRLSEPLTPDKPLAVDFIMTNSGTMEADVTVVSPTAHWDDKPPFKTWLKYLYGDPIRLKLEPGRSFQGTIRFPQALSKRTIEAITSGKGRLVVFAKGEYKDVFGRTYPLPYCRVYDKEFRNLVFCPPDYKIDGEPPN